MTRELNEAYLDWLKVREKGTKTELDARREIGRHQVNREREAGAALPDCEMCNGTGSVSCHRCSGTGQDTCIVCRGSGWTSVGFPVRMMLCSCRKGKVGCVGCNAKGTVPCDCTLAGERG